MSILNSLVSTAAGLRAYEQVLEVTQNNVANASTAGYVKQRRSLEALPFDPNLGAGGGVRAGEIQSARDVFAEQAVRRQTTLLGHATQNVDSFSSLQSVFDISGDAGIAGALSSLFQSFSAWAQSPTGAIERQNVMERAAGLAYAFQQTAEGLVTVAQDSEQQVQQTVERINHLTGLLQGFNTRLLQGNTQDAALDAQIYSTLEELSQYAGIIVLKQDDGSLSVLMNGQTPLVIGDRQFPIGYRLNQPSEPPPVNPTARPLVQVVAADGTDITKQSTSGKLGALLDFRNSTLTSYSGDAYQEGDLNRMARQFADRVNELLTSGYISEGPPPVPGVALFAYDAADPTRIAQTIAVHPATTWDELAAISPGPPLVSNGIPLALSNLSNPQTEADRIDGASHSEFYGNLAARAGRALSDAQTEQEVQQSGVNQAKAIREQLGGVSLDEEAAIMIQFQRSYEASSRMIAVLDQLLQEIIDMLRP